MAGFYGTGRRTQQLYQSIVMDRGAFACAIPLCDEDTLVRFHLRHQRWSFFAIELRQSGNQRAKTLRHVGCLAVECIAQRFGDALPDGLAVNVIEMDVLHIDSIWHGMFQFVSTSTQITPDQVHRGKFVHAFALDGE